MKVNKMINKIPLYWKVILVLYLLLVVIDMKEGWKVFTKIKSGVSKAAKSTASGVSKAAKSTASGITSAANTTAGGITSAANATGDYITGTCPKTYKNELDELQDEYDRLMKQYIKYMKENPAANLEAPILNPFL